MALAEGSALPERYYLYMRVWFALGWPAFAGVVAIFFVMAFEPASDGDGCARTAPPLQSRRPQA